MASGFEIIQQFSLVDHQKPVVFQKSDFSVGISL